MTDGPYTRCLKVPQAQEQTGEARAGTIHRPLHPLLLDEFFSVEQRSLGIREVLGILPLTHGGNQVIDVHASTIVLNIYHFPRRESVASEQKHHPGDI